VLSHELNQTLSGLRVNNIYDLSSRIFLFKFQKPDHREQFILDPGFRCHLTGFVRTTAAEPSPFVRKLRKLLGSRRVSSVSQIGTDRIIEFQFSDGLYRLFFEFYAGGNVVVTDKEYNVLALLRNVNDGSELDQLRIGAKYNISAVKHHDGVPELTIERVKLGLESIVAKTKEDAEKAQEAPNPTAKTKKKQRVTQATLRKAIASSISEFPMVLIDHALKVHDIDASASPEAVLSNEQQLNQLFDALQEAKRVVAEITAPGNTTGYIFAKRRGGPPQALTTNEKNEDGSAKAEENLMYEEFQPFKPKQFADDPKYVCLEFDGFNKTVDDFYSSIEGQKLDSKLHERELTAKKKLEATKRQHQLRLGSLDQAQELNIKKAEAITANVERVQEATAAVNGLISQGMDWVDIGRLIEAEQSRGNPVAQLVKLPLKLHENTVTLLLDEPEAEDDDSGYAGSEQASDTSDSDQEEEDKEEEESSKNPRRKGKVARADKRLAIDVDLSLSPWANASQYYDQKRAAADKKERTALASTAALKSAQKKIEADLKKGLSKEKDILRPVRTSFWFEKFYFFLSSDGHLVLAGKDAQQNDMIYSRYFKKGDVFVHADINGASPVIIKNKPETPGAPIPPSTLSQAGILAVATSSAWDSKAIMAAYWVNFEQVTKVNPNGDYLGPGDFHVTGEKSFLPPAQLLVGVGIAFEITEESKARHNKHRLQGITSRSDSPDVTAELISEDKQDESDEEFPDSQPNKAADDDSDEDFPDAVPQAKFDSDDEDFPDANPNVDIDSDVEENSIPNPLQASVANQKTPTKEEQHRSAMDRDAQEIVSVAESAFSSKSGRRHLSAKERRLQKKGIKPEDQSIDTPSGLQTPRDKADSDSDGESTWTATTSNPRSSGPLPRGKRTKLKKAAAKYANQDEEDRHAAMLKLGVRANPERKAEQAAERYAREQEEIAQKQRRREQHLLKQAVGKAQERARLAVATGDGDDETPDAPTDLSVINKLVGKLLPGDEVISAVAVCAPWNALASYKYKAKMQPGGLKKGKAAKEILFKWQTDAKVPRNIDPKSEDAERIWPREAELIAGLKDTEVISVMPVGKVRVMMGGGQGAGASKKGAGARGNKSARGGKGSKR
jgi:predicted ribosome quality control (RQC) complex YloA/Tae2 family protein